MELLITFIVSLEKMFAIKVGDEIFDFLEGVEEIFQCEECDTWLNMSVHERKQPGYCRSCAEDMNS